MFRKSLYLMTLPALLLFALFVFFPLIRGFTMSLTDWNGFSQHYSFVGLQNYGDLTADRRVLRAAANTLIIAVCDTTLQVVLGLLYALLLNHSGRLISIWRTVIYIPVMVSTLIMGYIWYFMLQYPGALNDIRLLFNAEAVDWLLYPKYAVSAIIVVGVLQFVGQSMIIFIAGLKRISPEIYEAADIDGANARRKFFRITLPSLRPALVTVVTLKLIGSLQIYDLIVALTDGGPGNQTHSVSTMIGYLYYGSEKAGYAAALGIVLFAAVLVLTLATNRVLGPRQAGR